MIFIDQPAQVGFSYSIPVSGMYIRSNPFRAGRLEIRKHEQQQTQHIPGGFGSIANTVVVDLCFHTIPDSKQRFANFKRYVGYINPDDGSVVVLANGTCPNDNITQETCGTYSDPNVTDTPTTTSAAAPAFWATLQGFMGAFPQYSRDAFHFATGKCCPISGSIFRLLKPGSCQRVTADTTGRFLMNISKVKMLKPFLVRITSALRRSLLAMGGTIL